MSPTSKSHIQLVRYLLVEFICEPPYKAIRLLHSNPASSWRKQCHWLPLNNACLLYRADVVSCQYLATPDVAQSLPRLGKPSSWRQAETLQGRNEVPDQTEAGRLGWESRTAQKISLSSWLAITGILEGDWAASSINNAVSAYRTTVYTWKV